MVSMNTINTFAELNLVDPFPPPAATKSTRASRAAAAAAPRAAGGSDLDHMVNFQDAGDISEQLVYDASKMLPWQPPTMIFVPSRSVLRKLMRICASAKELSDIYYFI